MAQMGRTLVRRPTLIALSSSLEISGRRSWAPRTCVAVVQARRGRGEGAGGKAAGSTPRGRDSSGGTHCFIVISIIIIRCETVN